MATSVQDHQSVAKAAMEKRLADAKAKLVLQQQQEQKNEIKTDSLLTPTLSKPSTTKDHHKQDENVVYTRLSHPVDENLLLNNVKLSSTKGTIVKKLLDNLYRSGDCSQKYLQGNKKADLVKEKDKYINLDNLVQSRSGSKKVSSFKSSKRSKNRMSMKRLKKSGALDLPQDQQKFELFKPMHSMWESYMMQIIKATGGKAHLASTILSADLHGAPMFVAECKIESYTGVQGIMVRETSETFGIITRDDKFRVIPKKHSVFIIQLECWKFTLLGDKYTSRDNILQR